MSRNKSSSVNYFDPFSLFLYLLISFSITFDLDYNHEAQVRGLREIRAGGVFRMGIHLTSDSLI